MFLAALKPTETAGSATAATLRNSDSPLFQCPLARIHRPLASFPALSTGRATATPALSINAPVVSSASSMLSWSWAIDVPPSGLPAFCASQGETLCCTASEPCTANPCKFCKNCADSTVDPVNRADSTVDPCGPAPSEQQSMGVRVGLKERETERETERALLGGGGGGREGGGAGGLEAVEWGWG